MALLAARLRHIAASGARRGGSTQGLTSGFLTASRLSHPHAKIALMSTGHELTPEETRAIVRALRRPVGRYSYTRASQLSGVPTRTLHHWANIELFVPDFNSASPKGWSYRDLVLVRLFAWLRSLGMAPPSAGERVQAVRIGLASRKLDPTVPLRAHKKGLLVEGEHFDRLNGEGVLPFMVELLQAFDLTEPVDEIGRMWGPSLVRPSEYTAISPSVVAGEPFLLETRIPTATLFALHEEQGLGSGDIVDLYPGISTMQVDDALELEGRIRQLRAA